MGIGTILLFALLSIELYTVVHGADHPTSTSTTFEDGHARDLLQISGKTANDFDGSHPSVNSADQHFENWLEMIQRDANSNNVSDWATDFQNGLSNGDVNGEGVTKVITVAQTGIANFRRIQDAVDSVPADNPQRVVIYIQSGIYKEKVLVPKNKSRITFQGQGKRTTIITWNDDANTLDNFGRPIGTFKTASVTVESDYFVAANITFQNDAYSPNSVNKYTQAVALRISGDMAMFYSCGFLGHQDTLLDDEGRHYFYKCTIKGTVDYIFGNGRSLYERCAIRSLDRFGAITAQGRADRNELTGFAFLRCRITGLGSPYLGRAWREYSRVVYIQSKFNIDLPSQAWSDFGHPGRRSTTFFGMYKCKGPAVKTAMRYGWTRQLTAEEARPFIDRSFINALSWFQPIAKLTLDPMQLQSTEIIN